MERLRVVEIDSLPSNMNCKVFIDSMLGSQFMLYHDLKNLKTFLVTGENDALARLRSAIPGLSFHEGDAASVRLNSPLYLVGYSTAEAARRGDEPEPILSNLYSLLGRSCSSLIVSFAPASKEHVERVRTRIEEMASGKGIRLTKNSGNRNGLSSSSDSMQMELFYESDERRMLLSLLDTLNEASLKNGMAYKISFTFESGGGSALVDYIRSRLFVFEERKISAKTIGDVYEFVKGADALPLSYADSAHFLAFSDRIARGDAIKTQYHGTKGEIEIGEYLHESLTGNGDALLLDHSVFNLGTIISGLPGTGKTATAMRMVSQLVKKTTVHPVIISPTGEWNVIGKSLGLKIVRLYDSSVRINFFRCDSGINIERFYENLAMLLASASNAGPYRNTMEKCLLSAFRNVYNATISPDPVKVYEEIENAVIEQHGKRSSVGVKYTKHGENTIAALQSLRLMLMKPQFAYPDGADFSELLKQGVVFDLSKVSNNMKPFFYALILNQVYSFTDMLDDYGNGDLRMLICIEEAQLMLDSDEKSAATLDLEQRIQDFRKKGVGLMLIAHSITDISLGIRRICQVKAYFRQSADAARYACNDLIFDEEQFKAVVERLKSLSQGTCAVNYVTVEGGMRVPHGSIFIKAQPYAMRDGAVSGCEEAIMPFKHAKTRVKILDSEGKPKSETPVELVYVGEKIFQGKTDKEGTVEIDDLMADREYRLLVLGAKKRETRAFKIIGGRDSTISLYVLIK